MKQLRKILAALAVATGGIMMSSGAAAVTICDNCDFQGDGTYLGSHNPTTDDNSGLRNTNTSLLGSFTDDWVFFISPSGLATVNGSFQLFAPPTLGITDFTIQLYNATATGCGAIETVCTTHALGSLIATSTYSAGTGSAAIVPAVALTGGNYYIIRVSGIADESFTSYSGQLQTTARQVAEPATLALLGLGLAGLGFARRRKQ